MRERTHNENKIQGEPSLDFLIMTCLDRPILMCIMFQTGIIILKGEGISTIE
jgi:hypothetical protein